MLSTYHRRAPGPVHVVTSTGPIAERVVYVPTRCGRRVSVDGVIADPELLPCPVCSPRRRYTISDWPWRLVLITNYLECFNASSST